MKKVLWNEAALESVRGYSLKVRQEIGALIGVFQRGERLGMPHSRPMKGFGYPAFELRVRDQDGIYRVIYVLFDQDRILVPHAFKKKTQKTPLQEIETGKIRLKRLIDENK